MAATSSFSSSDRSLPEVIASGDRRASLEAIRNKLAADLAITDGFHSAALAKQLADVIRELDSLPGGAEVSTVDDLAARRAARRSAAGT